MAGGKSIGEPEWKPHNCNVETNPYATTVKNRDDDLFHKSNPTSSNVSKLSKTRVKEHNNECVLNNDKKNFVDVDPSNFEWHYYKDGSKYGKRCVIDGQHFGNKETKDEIQLEHVIGTSLKVGDPRGELPCIAPGDKSYSVPEFSSDFYKEGSTLPAVNFGRYSETIADTFIPLQPLANIPSTSYLEKEKERKLVEEKEEVIKLDNWSPAKPLTAGFC